MKEKKASVEINKIRRMENKKKKNIAQRMFRNNNIILKKIHYKYCT